MLATQRLLSSRAGALRTATRRSLGTPAANFRFPDNLPLPNGFKAVGLRCGIKKKEGAKDLAILASDAPCSAAGVFTTNRFRAAPVLVSQELLKKHVRAACPSATSRLREELFCRFAQASDVHGVVINAGCANACTGPQGIKDAEETVQIAVRCVALCLLH